jgi:hypothetical protein
LPSYTEYIEYGSWSIGAINIVAAASIAHGLERECRHEDITLVDLERFFCAYHRILNDFHSAEKEKKEGCAGNLILLLESQFSEEVAVHFVHKEMDGYSRLIRECMIALGNDDPLVQLFDNATSQVTEWYAASPKRYSGENGIIG